MSIFSKNLDKRCSIIVSLASKIDSLENNIMYYQKKNKYYEYTNQERDD